MDLHSAMGTNARHLQCSSLPVDTNSDNMKMVGQVDLMQAFPDSVSLR